MRTTGPIGGGPHQAGANAPPPPSFHVYVVELHGRTFGAVSWLAPEEARTRGLPPEAVMLLLLDPQAGFADANVRTNQAFRLFLQAAMPALVEQSATVARMARALGEGWLAVPDGRAEATWAAGARHALPPRAPDDQVIGEVAVAAGEPQPASWRPNPAWRGFTAGQQARGVALIPNEFRSALLARLPRAAAPPPAR